MGCISIHGRFAIGIARCLKMNCSHGFAPWLNHRDGLATLNCVLLLIIATFNQERELRAHF
jgi:hypothetical protein